MKKQVKLFTYSGNTIVNIKGLVEIESLLPSYKDILEHLKVQIGQKEIKPIYIEVEEEKLLKINREIQHKSCQNVGYSKVLIHADSPTSNKSLLLVTIGLTK